MVEKPKKKPGRKKLETITVKERKLIKAQVEGKTLGQAAKVAGLNKNYASVVMNKPQVKEKFTDLLDKAGLSDSYLSDKIKSLAEADDIKFFAHNGTVFDERKFPALETQRKTIEFACKLKGHVVDKIESGLESELMNRLFLIPEKTKLEDWRPPDE
jgi:hypothetical protein